MKSFEVNLKLWQVHLETANTVHFSTLQEQKPAMASEYAGESAKVLQALGGRVQDLKSKQKELNIFATLFNVKSADLPDNLQPEITELPSNNEMKAKDNDLPLLKFYKLYVHLVVFSPF